MWRTRRVFCTGRLTVIAHRLRIAVILVVLLTVAASSLSSQAAGALLHGLLPNTRQGHAPAGERQGLPQRPTISPVDQLPTPLVLGYVDGSDEQFLAADGALGQVVNGVVPDWYTIYGNGVVNGTADWNLLWAARQRQWTVLGLVQNNGDPAALDILLHRPLAQARAITTLVGIALMDGYAGLNLDFEALPPSDGPNYVAFCQSLERALHRYGLVLSLSVPAETADLGAGTWDGAYSYRALGHVSDLLLLMAYDEHWPGSQPGAVAATSWVNQVIEYTLSQVPASHVVLGLPGYGYDWAVGTSTPAVPLSYAQAVALAELHGAPPNGHLTYWTGRIRHSVYYESGAAMVQQSRLAAEFGLRGLVIWRLGIEDPVIWAALRRG